MHVEKEKVNVEERNKTEKNFKLKKRKNDDYYDNFCIFLANNKKRKKIAQFFVFAWASHLGIDDGDDNFSFY